MVINVNDAIYVNSHSLVNSIKMSFAATVTGYKPPVSYAAEGKTTYSIVFNHNFLLLSHLCGVGTLCIFPP